MCLNSNPMKSQKNNSGNYADVVVVGAGPAGSTAALKLSEAGFSTLVIDSKMEIGAPVICADLVNLELPELEGLRDDTRVRLIEPEHVELRAGGRSFTIHPEMGENDAFNTVVERDRLDKELISRAVITGARLRIRSEFIDATQEESNVIVRYKESGRMVSVDANHLILANGTPKLGAKSEKLAERRIRYYYERSIIDKGPLIPVIDVGTGSNLNYLVPRGHNQFNRVGIRDSQSYLETTNDQKDRGREIISGNREVILAEEPILGNGRIIGAGIAAGLYDGFFLTGFRESVISGRLAAQAIIESQSSGDGALGSYSRKIEESLLKGMKTQLQFREELSKATLDQLADLFSTLSQYDYHKISVGEVLSRSGLTIRKIQEILGMDD